MKKDKLADYQSLDGKGVARRAVRPSKLRPMPFRGHESCHLPRLCAYSNVAMIGLTNWDNRNYAAAQKARFALVAVHPMV